MKILGYGLMVAGAIWIFYVRLSNIDVTETRLFIDNFLSLGMAVGALIAGAWLAIGREDK